MAFLDQAVAQGEAASRAALVTAALEREMRRQAAEADATILREQGPADDLDALVDWTMRNVEVSTASVREICLVRLDKTRPVVVLTREAARAAMTKVTVAPITSTIEGLSSEVPVGPRNGLESDSVISMDDNVVTIPATAIWRTVGYLTTEQESLLARAIVLAYDLDITLVGNS